VAIQQHLHQQRRVQQRVVGRRVVRARQVLCPGREPPLVLGREAPCAPIHKAPRYRTDPPPMESHGGRATACMRDGPGPSSNIGKAKCLPRSARVRLAAGRGVTKTPRRALPSCFSMQTHTKRRVWMALRPVARPTRHASPPRRRRGRPAPRARTRRACAAAPAARAAPGARRSLHEGGMDS
jgi:hypothetical protein